MSSHSPSTPVRPVSVLCIGDPHIHVNNLDEADIMIKEVLRVAKENKPTFIACLGDLLHTHEKIHTFALKKATEFMHSLSLIAPTYLIVGNHDMCFAKNTKVLMFDGSIKLSQNIKKGDEIMGDDYSPRKVKRTFTGSSKMYEVHQLKAKNYTVSEGHILCLNYEFQKKRSREEVEIKVEDVEKIPKIIRERLYGYRVKGEYKFLTKIKVIPREHSKDRDWETHN